MVNKTSNRNNKKSNNITTTKTLSFF